MIRILAKRDSQPLVFRYDINATRVSQLIAWLEKEEHEIINDKKLRLIYMGKVLQDQSLLIRDVLLESSPLQINLHDSDLLLEELQKIKPTFHCVLSESKREENNEALMNDNNNNNNTYTRRRSNATTTMNNSNNLEDMSYNNNSMFHQDDQIERDAELARLLAAEEETARLLLNTTPSSSSNANSNNASATRRGRLLNAIRASRQYAQQGSDDAWDFWWGFVLGFLIGPLMFFWVLESNSRQQKVGILAGTAMRSIVRSVRMIPDDEDLILSSSSSSTSSETAALGNDQ